MHGRPRTTQASDPARQKHEEAKIASCQALLQEVLLNHRQRNFSKEALLQNAKLLETNPEVYTAWNYRKLAVTHFLESQQDEAARKSVLATELHVIERALLRNFKSYGAWHHRKWVLQFGLSPLDHEYRLLDKLLSSDARNFNGWAYRRFLAKIRKATEEDELEYTINKINENFSNYSAWHSRSVLLSKQLLSNVITIDTWSKILTEEYDLVKQAFFTEPEDQSGWFYLIWLLGQTVIPSRPLLAGFSPPNGSSVILHLDAPSRTSVPACEEHYGLDALVVWPKECKQSFSRCEQPVEDAFDGLELRCERQSEPVSHWQVETLEAQIDTCRELLDLEEDSKWAMLTLARLLVAYDQFASPKEPHMDEVQQLYKGLVKVDPTHAHYYDEQLSLLLFDQITCSLQKLSEYCWRPQQSNHNQELWLRLNTLSLSKLGYFERLIWVQRLDLSNNKLCSLEGIEALQLLTLLDVSRNQLSSITSLRPISFLSKLKALNVEWNEIGLHSIDTNRYLWPTALNNSAKSFPNKRLENHKGPLYWEVFEVFSRMGLRQLDIHGNPISTTEMFRRQLIEALPSLIWLDGVRVSK